MNTLLSVLRGLILAPFALILSLVALPVFVVSSFAKAEVQDQYH